MLKINECDLKLKEKLEFCMDSGNIFVIVGVEDKIDPMLDPVMEKRKIQAKTTMIDFAVMQKGLLEDEELVAVLANTKAKAAEVNAKLIAVDEIRLNIAEKREQFRPAAIRGSQSWSVRIR